jgi:hypothetical protein
MTAGRETARMTFHTDSRPPTHIEPLLGFPCYLWKKCHHLHIHLPDALVFHSPRPTGSRRACPAPRSSSYLTATGSWQYGMMLIQSNRVCTLCWAKGLTWPSCTAGWTTACTDLPATDDDHTPTTQKASPDVVGPGKNPPFPFPHLV